MKKKFLILISGLIILTGCTLKSSPEKIIENFDKQLSLKEIKYIKFDYDTGIVGSKKGYIYTIDNEGPFYIVILDKKSSNYNNIIKQKEVTMTGSSGSIVHTSLIIKNDVALFFGYNSINSKQSEIESIFNKTKK